jgi:hypothetical protein
MKRYLAQMRDGNELMKPVRTIRWDVLNIDDIIVENHSKWAGLQLADCMSSAFFRGVEPNAYGNYEHRYAQMLTGRVLRKHGRALNCGVTPVPGIGKCSADAEQLAFFQSFDKV